MQRLNEAMRTPRYQQLMQLLRGSGSWLSRSAEGSPKQKCQDCRQRTPKKPSEKPTSGCGMLVTT